MSGSTLASLGSIALAAVCAYAAPATTSFKDVAVRCAASAKDPKLSSYAAEVALDDAGGALTLRMEGAGRRSISIPYADIVNAVAEVATSENTASGATQPEKHFWFYFERKSAAYPGRFSLELGETGAGLLAKLRPLLDSRLQVLEFPLAEELLSLDSLTDLAVNYSVHVQRPGQPVPEPTKDRALVVVVCPAVPGAHKQPINLDANGRVVAVNEPGTYSFVSLDPGDYTILSQAENARSFRVKLEAGHVYYFFQDVLAGGDRTSVSMHSKELALFELSGAAWSDWRRVRY